MNQRMPTLHIGDLEINPPIIQGGMGVRVSMSNLAAAVANEGCAGVIATAGIGRFEGCPRAELPEVNLQAIRDEIRKARSQTRGVIGVNIMVALSDYDNLVRTAVEAETDLIISGAGLPLHLPELVGDADVKLIPIISSVRTFNVILHRWRKRYGRLPDAVVIEGVKAGGHLGYSHQDVVEGTSQTLEEIIRDVLPVANGFDRKIPVIAAGGIYTGVDIARYLQMGVAGVQMATRFVCTHECDVHENFKKAYLKATLEDLAIIKSPVGLPGRVIRNRFVNRIEQGETAPFQCSYQCLRTCDPSTAPYCIAEVLANAANGNMEDSFCFAGENVYRCDTIVSVKELIAELVEQYQQCLQQEGLAKG